MQAFITEELIWALHRERMEEARRVWLASRVPEESSDDKSWTSGHTPVAPLNFRPAGGR